MFAFHPSKFFRSSCGKTLLLALTLFFIFFPASGHALTMSEEKELGDKTLEKIKAHMPLVEDGEVLTYVQQVGNRVARQVGVTPYEYQFFVINQSVPNAFAIPGGYIFIYRGLIEMMSSEGELAGIFSHEMAHIQARHIHRRLEEGRILTVASIAGILAGALLGAAGGGAASQAVAMGAMAGAQAYQLKYSRDNEEEADQLGLRYLIAAGYDPENMVSVMEKLNQAKWMGDSSIPSYLTTHPALNERIQYLRDLAQKENHPNGSKGTATEGDFSVMQASLVAEYGDPRTAQDRFLSGVRKGDSASMYGLGRLYLRQGKTEEAVSLLQEAARKDPKSPFILSTLGEAYRQVGRLADAKRTLQTALLLNPSTTIAHFRLASILGELGENKEAYEHLRQIEKYAPSFPEIDYQLGVVLGKLNQIGEAHFYLGRYYLNRHDWKVALFHYQKAKAQVVGDPQKSEEIERGLKEIEQREKEMRLKMPRN